MSASVFFYIPIGGEFFTLPISGGVVAVFFSWLLAVAHLLRPPSLKSKGLRRPRKEEEEVTGAQKGGRVNML